jgi:hypothetical protein
MRLRTLGGNIPVAATLVLIMVAYHLVQIGLVLGLLG